MDDWSDEPYAPRRVLTGVMQEVAGRQAEERRRPQRVARARRFGADASDLSPGPVAPP